MISHLSAFCGDFLPITAGDIPCARGVPFGASRIWFTVRRRSYVVDSSCVLVGPTRPFFLVLGAIVPELFPTSDRDP